MARKRLGNLFTIDGSSLGTFYDDMKVAHERLQMDQRAMVHFTKSGAGFSPHAARLFKEEIQKAILSKSQGKWTSGFPVMNQRYTKMKQEQGTLLNHWVSSGNVERAFVVKSKRPRSSVGRRSYAWLELDPSVQSPAVNLQGRIIKWVPVQDVFRWLEFGTTRMQARPLFSIVLRKFISRNVPKMISVVDDALRRWIKTNHNEKARTHGTKVKAEVTATMSEASLGRSASPVMRRSKDGSRRIVRRVANANPENDFGDAAVKDLTRSRGEDLAELSSDDRRLREMGVAEARKEDASMRKSLIESGMSEAEADAFMREFRNAAGGGIL